MASRRYQRRVLDELALKWTRITRSALFLSYNNYCLFTLMTYKHTLTIRAHANVTTLIGYYWIYRYIIAIVIRVKKVTITIIFFFHHIT